MIIGILLIVYSFVRIIFAKVLFYVSAVQPAARSAEAFCVARQGPWKFKAMRSNSMPIFRKIP